MGLSPNASALISVVTVLSLLQVIAIIYLLVRQHRILKRFRALLKGSPSHNLEDLLVSQGAELDSLKTQVKSLTDDLEAHGTAALRHIQGVGVVRFNAFADTGSDLSFAIALLDAHHNGVVLSSLYARSESRIYAKPVQNGKSTYALSDEEKEAIVKAGAAGP